MESDSAGIGTGTKQGANAAISHRGNGKSGRYARRKRELYRFGVRARPDGRLTETKARFRGTMNARAASDGGRPPRAVHHTYRESRRAIRHVRQSARGEPVCRTLIPPTQALVEHRPARPDRFRKARHSPYLKRFRRSRSMRRQRMFRFRVQRAPNGKFRKRCKRHSFHQPVRATAVPAPRAKSRAFASPAQIGRAHV